MIAVCPKCSARYRVAVDQLGGGEAKLRCSRCQAVFKVRAPAAQPALRQQAAAPVLAASSAVASPVTAPPVPVARPAPVAVAAPPSPVVQAVPAPQPTPPKELDRARAVLVAHPDVETAKILAGRLARVGLQPLLAHDGVEALLGLQRNLPRAAVLHGGLARMSAAELCEVIKRNGELREIAVAWIDAVPARGTGEPFGPDLRLDGVRLEAGLVEGLRRLGLPVALPSPAPQALPPAPGPRPVAAPAGPATAPPPPVAPTLSRAVAPPAPVRASSTPAPVAPLVAPPLAPAADGLDAERVKAQRLARVIVSDVILYNEQKFMRAVVAGNVREAMDGDLQEGRTLFRQRIDARIQDELDYVGEELLRVARSRGMQG